MKKLISLILLCALCLSMLSLSACEFPWNKEPDQVQLNIIDDKYRNWYEIFVHSFYDTNNDGIGDLNGVTAKLDYIQEMGFNGIWLMPIHPSPTYHKYDVTDYYAIDPDYGTLDDFKKSLRESLCNDTVFLNDNDVMAIEELSREYYSHEFIYGNNPACTYSSVARYDGVGELRLLLEIKENIIRRANLSGDFFIIGDIDDVLLSKLKNVPYTRVAVEEAVAGIDFGALIMNLNKEQLINLFFN